MALIVISSGVIGLILGTFILWLCAKGLRFRNPSFWTSFQFMAIAIGAAVAAILAISNVLSMAIVEAGIAIIVVVGVIAVVLLFREPVWKSISAIALVLVSEILLFWVSIGVLVALFAHALSKSNFQ